MGGEDSESPLLELPLVDADVFRSGDAAAADAEAAKLAQALHAYGVLLLRDSRVTEADNDAFLDLLERYMGQPEEDKVPDIRREFHYQVGLTPARVELPRDHCARIKAMAAAA
jgi:isopenicillin N synthase-like dioxygenase